MRLRRKGLKGSLRSRVKVGGIANSSLVIFDAEGDPQGTFSNQQSWELKDGGWRMEDGGWRKLAIGSQESGVRSRESGVGSQESVINSQQ